MVTKQKKVFIWPMILPSKPAERVIFCLKLTNLGKEEPAHVKVMGVIHNTKMRLAAKLATQ